MNKTGYMPPRGRAVVTIFLVNDLKQDYRLGAMYFEDKLIDHDFHLNDGGWRFFCGMERVPY
jgi:deoxyribodipyrimidine photo-lyase